MKKVLLLLAVAGIMATAHAQGDTKKEAPKSDMKMKEHVCTKACTKDHHVYAHGEKGHVCTDACKKKGKA
jgi:Ni/Co efflux regulator RcnB